LYSKKVGNTFGKYSFSALSFNHGLGRVGKRPKRIKTKYPGVYYRETKRTGNNNSPEKVYYIVFKKPGKVHEEKVGGSSSMI
jgi:hypothetical protein